MNFLIPKKVSSRRRGESVIKGQCGIWGGRKVPQSPPVTPGHLYCSCYPGSQNPEMWRRKNLFSGSWACFSLRCTAHINVLGFYLVWKENDEEIPLLGIWAGEIWDIFGIQRFQRHHCLLAQVVSAELWFLRNFWDSKIPSLSSCSEGRWCLLLCIHPKSKALCGFSFSVQKNLRKKVRKFSLQNFATKAQK